MYVLSEVHKMTFILISIFLVLRSRNRPRPKPHHFSCWSRSRSRIKMLYNFLNFALYKPRIRVRILCRIILPCRSQIRSRINMMQLNNRLPNTKGAGSIPVRVNLRVGNDKLCLSFRIISVNDKTLETYYRFHEILVL
jgi:hypothetical protein